VREIRLADAGEGSRIDHAVVSSDGAHVAACVERGRGQLVITRDREGKPYDRVSSLTLSPDGKRLAYVAWTGQRQPVVADGRESGEYPPLQVQAGLAFGGGCARFVTIERTKAALIELQLPRESGASRADIEAVSDVFRGVWTPRPQIPLLGSFSCGRDVPVQRTVTFIPYVSLRVLARGSWRDM